MCRCGVRAAVMASWLAMLLLSSHATAIATASKPHIVFTLTGMSRHPPAQRWDATVMYTVLYPLTLAPLALLPCVDDLGWNTAWHNPDIISPTLNSLAAGGVELMAHYTYRYCSPTRAAFLTGRSPYKLLNIRENLIPAQIPESTDPRFTMLPKRLQEADYISYQVGKCMYTGNPHHI